MQVFLWFALIIYNINFHWTQMFFTKEALLIISGHCAWNHSGVWPDLRRLLGPARWPTCWCDCLCRAMTWAARREPRLPETTPRCWLSCKRTEIFFLAPGHVSAIIDSYCHNCNLTSWTECVLQMASLSWASSCVRFCSSAGHMWTVYWTGSARDKDWRSWNQNV